MGWKIIGTSSIRQAFLEEAAEYGEEVLTEAIGSVLWCELAKNAVSAEQTLGVPEVVAVCGRFRSRDPILSYVQTHEEINMEHVEGCAGECGSKAALYSLQEQPSTTMLTVGAFDRAWREISERIKKFTLGFAC